MQHDVEQPYTFLPLCFPPALAFAFQYPTFHTVSNNLIIFRPLPYSPFLSVMPYLASKIPSKAPPILLLFIHNLYLHAPDGSELSFTSVLQVSRSYRSFHPKFCTFHPTSVTLLQRNHNHLSLASFSLTSSPSPRFKNASILMLFSPTPESAPWSVLQMSPEHLNSAK